MHKQLLLVMMMMLCGQGHTQSGTEIATALPLCGDGAGV